MTDLTQELMKGAGGSRGEAAFVVVNYNKYGAPVEIVGLPNFAQEYVDTMRARAEALVKERDELFLALNNLPAVYAHQINTGFREVYDPLQRFYTMESVWAVFKEKQMDFSKHVSLWNGKPLTEFSKAELIDIIDQLGAMLAEEKRSSMRELNILNMIRKRAQK
jgi:hypothetical protein